MKHKTGLRKRKSLCEKSMVLVANIIKLSSVSLGQMSLGTTSGFTSAAAYSDHKITRVNNTSTTCAAEKVSLDVESPHSPRRSQEKPEQPAAAVAVAVAAAEKDHQSKQAKVIPQAFTTVTTPSSVHVKPDHRVLTEDVNDRAEDFIRRKRQIINDVNTSSTSTTTASKGPPPYTI